MQQQTRPALRLMSTTNTSSMLDMFKSVGKYSEQKLKNAKALLMQDPAKEEEEKSFIGHSHGEHAAALERDLLKIVKNQGGGGHGHSHDNGHGHSHDGEHGHSHDDEHGHSHAKPAVVEDDDEDFVEMWNHQAPAGSEHGGPRGKEPTRYGNEWEKNGRVTDFS